MTDGRGVRDRRAEVLDRLGPTLSGTLDLWTRRTGGKGPRLRLDELAAAALRIADGEGIDALSMRRLAAELGVGTMTLYHYVKTKDELLALLTDTVMGELRVDPAEVGPDPDWRQAITAIAHRGKSVLERHPWMFDIVEDPTIGPNGVRHFDQALEAVAGLPGTLADHLDVITAVDEFVFGFCLHERGHRGRTGEAGRDLLPYVDDLVASGDYPRLGALVREHGVEALWEQVTGHLVDPGRFDRALRRLLDGIAADLGA